MTCGLSSCGSRALEHRLSSCGAWASLLHGTWDLPGPGIEPVSPALAGRFLTTAPPGRSQSVLASECISYDASSSPTHPPLFQLVSPPNLNLHIARLCPPQPMAFVSLHWSLRKGSDWSSSSFETNHRNHKAVCNFWIGSLGVITCLVQSVTANDMLTSS